MYSVSCLAAVCDCITTHWFIEYMPGRVFNTEVMWGHRESMMMWHLNGKVVEGCCCCCRVLHHITPKHPTLMNIHGKLNTQWILMIFITDWFTDIELYFNKFQLMCFCPTKNKHRQFISYIVLWGSSPHKAQIFGANTAASATEPLCLQHTWWSVQVHCFWWAQVTHTATNVLDTHHTCPLKSGLKEQKIGMIQESDIMIHMVLSLHAAFILLFTIKALSLLFRSSAYNRMLLSYCGCIVYAFMHYINYIQSSMHIPNRHVLNGHYTTLTKTMVFH